MQPVIVGQLRSRERLAHRIRVRRGKAVCLEIGEAPIGLPESGIQIERAAIRSDALRQSTGGS